MFRRLGRALAVGAGFLSVAMAAQPAAATTWTFDTTSASDSTLAAGAGNAKIFSTTSNGSTLYMRVTAWHATAKTASTDDIDAARLGLYTPGLGVVADGESTTDATHQIDNVGGTDFVMLQFSQAVTLTGFGRKVFQMSGVSAIDSDAAYWADTTGAIGTAATYNKAIDISSYTVDETLWTGVDGGGADSSAMFVSGKGAAVWLVGAAFDKTSSASGNDGFKINSIRVGSVPEPATWAMMLAGFGMVGAAARHKRAGSPHAA